MEEATMTRYLIGLLVTLALAILVAPLAAEAQQPKNVPRIGLLITNSRAAESTSIEAFHRGLQALGYVEGQNIMMEYRYADMPTENWINCPNSRLSWCGSTSQ
jgi:hypothetical protein